MAQGARSKFGAPMFEPEFFRKQMYCIEESTCDIAGTFPRPRSDSVPGACVPLAPSLRPCNCGDKYFLTLEQSRGESIVPSFSQIPHRTCETFSPNMWNFLQFTILSLSYLWIVMLTLNSKAKYLIVFGKQA